MQRTTTFKISLAVVALSMVVALAAMAGEYHFGGTLKCAECHTMHASQGHDYNTGGTTVGPTGDFPQAALGTGVPHEFLLRDEENALCLSCHNSQSFAPDVLEANTGSTIRQAGALNLGGTAPYETWNGHTLGSENDIPGGGTGSAIEGGLLCISCHNAHGYQGGDATTDIKGNLVASAYRNLVSYGPYGGAKAVSYSIGTGAGPDNTKDVYLRQWTSGQMVNYDVSKMDLNEPVSTDSGMGAWCGQCHGEFHGTVESENIGGTVAAGHFKRHPTAGVDIGDLGGGHSNLSRFGGHRNRLKVMDPNGDWGDDAVGDPWLDANADLTATCITCHKAHGNKNAFGLIYMLGTGATVDEEGDDGDNPTQMCQQCHVQGAH
ncbi:cytochrome c3 family protein [Candidatus Poribacteria bacterium]